MSGIYPTSPVKRQRRTNAQLAAVDDAIVAAIRQDRPVTLRGVYYRAVSMGAVEKTETGYDLIQRQLLKLRRTGEVNYTDIVDGMRTRWVASDTYDSLDQMLDDASESYRRALWRDQPAYVELFTEKDAIRGAVGGVCTRWDVPFSVLRGYSSETFTWSTAKEIERALDDGKEVYIYQLGDHDPSGVGAWRSFQERISGFLDDWGNDPEDVTFERLAVTPEQITTMGLLTRPTKKTDPRATKFDGESVEVDAIPAPTLRQIVRDAIEQHIDEDALALTRTVEQSERETLSLLKGLVA